MDFHLWLAFVAASSILLIIPGPTVLLVLSYAVSQGRKVALVTALGVALGDLVAMSASLLGLGALVAASATLFTALKWIGAVYLVFLGIKMWRAAPGARLGEMPEARDTRPRAVFLHAATVTALNPKSIAFFIAFVPQFLRPAEPLAPQFVTLIATFVILGALNAFAWAVLAGGLRDRIRRPAVLTALGRAGGSALIAMGLATATLRRSA